MHTVIHDVGVLQEVLEGSPEECQLLRLNDVLWHVSTNTNDLTHVQVK